MIVLRQKRLINLKKISGLNLDEIQIGVPVETNEAEKIGLHNIGDMLIPSSSFGVKCKRNAYGYAYSDKTKPKTRRYICTNWIQPFGNEHASPVANDIYKKCYPKVEVAPTEIELLLCTGEDEKKYVIVDLTNKIRNNYLLDAINIVLEIYNVCYIFNNGIKVDCIKTRCHWEILPPGEKPSIHFEKQLRANNKGTNTYNVERLKFLDSFQVEKCVEGTNGFNGYYAYVFDKNICVLESAVYGNATYIIPKESWEILSQKTKLELFVSDKVIAKIIHTSNWKEQVSDTINSLL